MADREAVRAAFRTQADWCARLEAPFTAQLCRILANILDAGSALGDRILGWTSNAESDALALRLCGGLHALVRRGDDPMLASLYPPAPAVDDPQLEVALTATLAGHADRLLPWLDSAPQTNEVGRSAALMSGLLVLAERFQLPFRLFELGASAGLNLQLDRYAFDLGGVRAGDARSGLRLAPDWRGPPPPVARVRVARRAGVDLHPIDPAQARERLLAYVWPDQPRRLQQLGAALDIAERGAEPIDRGDAADWLDAMFALAPEPGLCRVVLHSVAFQYFPAAAQARIAARLDQAGALAHEAAPLAWLRLEKMPEDTDFSLRLRCWPGGEERLAWSHPHGAWIEWAALIASAPARR